MAFFSKLKDRLFKSSSKLDQGLDAIVGDAPDASTPMFQPLFQNFDGLDDIKPLTCTGRAG
ncbi:MAG: signal recognition particle-docking protein FtsY, partial [Rhodobacteraceae bacterium]|nr:signal recognition particle-docking protein FtsY [Paracoccaceae bacterium]